MPLLPNLIGGLEFRERAPRYRGEPTYKRLDFVRSRTDKDDFDLVKVVYPESSHRRSGSGGKQKFKAIEAPQPPHKLTAQQWEHAQREQARQQQMQQQAFRDHQQREAMRQAQMHQQAQQQMQQARWEQAQMGQMGGHGHGHGHGHGGHGGMQGGHHGGMPPPPPMHHGPQVNPMQAGGPHPQHHPQIHQQQHPHQMQHGGQPQMGFNPPRMLGNQRQATFADIVELHNSDDDSEEEAIVREIRPRRRGHSRGHSRPESVMVVDMNDVYETSSEEEEDTRHRSRSRDRRRRASAYHR